MLKRLIRAAPATFGMLALTGMLSPSAAQTPEQESAIGTDMGGYGGFIGPDLTFGDMADEFAAFVGGHAALLLKHRVYLGLKGAALATDASKAVSPVGSTVGRSIGMGYGGLLVGYVVPTPGLVQVTADALLAGGGVRLEDEIGSVEDDEDWDPIFVFEPNIGAELKLARIVRLGFGVGYRFVGGVDTPGLTDADLRGVTGSATLRFGWF